MPQRARLMPTKQRSCIRERLARASHEFTEARVPGSSPTPHESDGDNRERRVANPLMPWPWTMPRQPREQHSERKQPVTHTHDPIPNQDRAHRTGIVAAHSFLVGTGASVFGWKYASTRSPFSF